LAYLLIACLFIQTERRDGTGTLSIPALNLSQKEVPTPYNIVKRGSKFCVISTDSGKTHGCHPTKADARQQQKAMYVHANPKKEKKEK
jgi:hypothetical protein